MTDDFMDMDDFTETDLPEFLKQPKHQVNMLMTQVFADQFIKLVEYDDHHFRAIFRSTQFVLADGATEPSKSQWSTLKKKLKRRDHRIFVFKQSGFIDCSEVFNDDLLRNFRCCYVDFGFFKYE